MTRSTLAVLLPAFLMTAGIAACPDPARAPETETASTSQAQGAAPQLPGNPDDVVAEIGDQKITLAEVDDSIKGELSAAQQEYKDAIAELRQQAVERRIMEQLLDEEAKKKGYKDGEELVQKEIEEGTPEPTEEEMKAFYERSKAQMGGATYEQVKPRIKAFLENQAKRDKFMAMAEKLRSEANVKVDLPMERRDVEAVGPAMGPENAPVTIVAFSDFQCPYCSRAVPTIQQIEKAYGDKVRVVFRDFPLPIHPKARKAAEAANCAADQGKFWQMHDLLFENQQALDVPDLKKYAGEIDGIDQKAFDECLDSDRMAVKIDEDLEAGKALGVTGTPAFFVNGVMITGAQPFPAFKQVIDKELERAGVPVPSAETAPEGEAQKPAGQEG